MKSRRGKVRRSLALFLALALIFTTFLGDVSIANAQEVAETKASADEKPEKREKPQEKETPAEKPQKKEALTEKSQEKEAPAEKPQEKSEPEEKKQEKPESTENAQEKPETAENPQEKTDSAEKPQAEPEKQPAAEEPKQPEVKDDGSGSEDEKTDDKAETPKDDSSSKEEAKPDNKEDTEEKAEKYTVRFKVENLEAGVITVDGSSINAASYKKDVEEGKDFNFSVTAKEGFDVESVTVENADVAKNSAVKDGYVVKEVKKDTEISVRYKEVLKEETEKDPEVNEENPEEEKSVPKETEETPEAVKAFLDAAAALPLADEVTKENALEVGEKVNAVLDMWEALDEELAEREDVQAALEKVYAVYEAVLKAEEIEEADPYLSAIPGFTPADRFYDNKGKEVAQLYVGTYPNNPVYKYNNPASSISVQVGDKGSEQYLYTKSAICHCGNVLVEVTPDWIAVDSNRKLTYTDKSIVKNLTWNLSGYKGSETGYNGYPALQINVEGAKPGSTAITFQAYQNYYYYYTWQQCRRCGQRYSEISFKGKWIEDTQKLNVTVNADYILHYDTQGGSSLEPDRKNVADTKAVFSPLKTPTRPGWTFEGWYYDQEGKTPVGESVTLQWKDGFGSKDKPVSQTIYAKWKENGPETPDLKISDFQKKLVNSAADIPDGINVSGITYPDADGKVMIPDDGTSVTLLYTITVTGDPGKEYEVKDSGAKWVEGSAPMKGTIPAGKKAVIYVTKSFTKDDIKDGQVINTAIVTPGKDDESTTTGTETTPAGTPEKTTLQVEKEADKDFTEKGDTIVYTITVKNTGAHKAENVVIIDQLDSSKLEFISAKLGDKEFETEPAGGRYPVGDMEKGASATLTITAKVKDNVKPEDVIHNEADAQLDNPAKDVTPDTEDVTVGGSPLDVTKDRISDAKVVAGSTINWEITIKNNTNQDKTVKISDVLSNGEKITVTEDKQGEDQVTSITMAAGETKTLYASYVTKESDINAALKNTVTVTPEDGDDKEAEDEGTEVVGPDRKVTIEYVSDQGERLQADKVAGPFKDGDRYDVDNEIPSVIEKDGHRYIKERVEGAVEGTIDGEDVIIRVIYKIDEIGTEPENPTPENPTPEDPTPENPTPEDPAPDNPTPIEPVITPTIPDTTPTVQTTPIITRTTPAPATPAITPAGLTPAAPVITPAGLTPAAPVIAPETEEEPEEVRAVEDEEAPLANTEIKDEEVPLAGESGRWALINFALMNLAIFESLMLLIGYFVQTKKSSEEEEEDEKNGKERKLKKKGIIRLISLPVAIVSLIAFFLTENIWLPTQLVDEYTLMMAIIAIFQTIVVVLSRKEENLEDAETEPEAEMA
ncbi:MAG: DUF11 domain-containing protein [Dorea sp.]|jgi:uncharacterized repeat protein (TIGR01451 family)/uncharacterized repeat protein (TIGR02543 family)|nr:DUF11 domain-containing protein [Dorea sp.]